MLNRLTLASYRILKNNKKFFSELQKMNKSTKILVPLIIAISVSAGIIIGNLLTRNSNTGMINIGLGEGSKISSVINLIE